MGFRCFFAEASGGRCCLVSFFFILGENMHGCHLALFFKKRIGIIFLAIGMLGLLLGWRGKWLPQNADVTMVAVLFVYLGMVWKEHAEIFDRYELGIFLRFLVYGYIVCVLVFISKWQGKATLICLSAYLRLYVVLLLSVVCARHRKK